MKLKFWLYFGVNIVLMWLTAAAGFAQTFTVRIPDRTASYYPTGKITVTLQMSADPTGSTLVVGSHPAQTLSLPSHTVFGSAPADTVNFRLSGTNTLAIDYLPGSQFSVAGQYCNLVGSPTFPYDVTFTLTSPATVVSSTLSSYTVAGVPGTITPVTCSTLPRRVDHSAPFFTVNPPGSAPTRGPLDIILVLDKSGSMFDVPTGDTISKWSILQKSVQAFIDLWEQTDSNVSTDRLAVVFYDNIITPKVFSGTIFVTRGTNPPGNTHNWEVIRHQLDLGVISPGGSTAMGHGLKAGLCKWIFDANHGSLSPGQYCNGYPDATDGATNGANDAEIVLMTDGLQNTDPCIVPNGVTGCFNNMLGGTNWTIDGDTSTGFHLYEQGVPIQTIGLGATSGTIPYDVLDRVARETGGIVEQTSTSATATTSFGALLVGILKGNTLSVISQTSGTFNLSAPPAATKLQLDGSVKRASFVLSWQGPADLLDLQIIPPGGCSGSTEANCTTVSPVVRSDGPTWTVQSIDIPASGPTGEWRVRPVARSFLIGSLGAPPLVVNATAQPSTATYQLSSYVDEGRLKYRIDLPELGIGTGDSVTLAAEISYDGKPLTGLTSGVTVHIDRPNTGAGTFLHNNQVSQDVLNKEITPGDQTTPYERKIVQLEKTTNLDGAVAPQPIPTTYPLRDNGNSANGDNTANDGVYSAKIGDTSVPGLYVFTITMDWDDPRTGKIHRVETLKRQVSVKPDAGKSVVAVAQAGSPGAWTLQVQPIDKFGNYLGPGYAGAFQVQVSGGGTVSGSPGDQTQSGNYSISLTGVPAGADPTVTITVGGTQIRNCQLSKCAGAGGGGAQSKFAVFADFGAGIPHGNFSNAFDPGFSFNAGLEYIVNPHFSAEGIFGVHHFPGKIAGDTTAIQFGGGGKVFLNPGHPNLVFARAGIAGYHFTSATTNVGGYFGVGVLHQFNAHFGLEGVYTFHVVNTPVAATQFSSIQGGVRYAF